MPTNDNDAWMAANSCRHTDSAGTPYGVRHGRSTGPIRPRILLVEYRDEVQSALKDVLGDSGCEVTCSEPGEHVLAAANRSTPHLIMINADMPDQSGWLLAAKLRFGRFRGQIWLYSSRQKSSESGWAEFAEVDRFIEHYASLRHLLESAGRQIVDWLCATGGDPKKSLSR